MCAAHRLSLNEKHYSSSSKGTQGQDTQGWLIQETMREAEGHHITHTLHGEQPLCLIVSSWEGCKACWILPLNAFLGEFCWSLQLGSCAWNYCPNHNLVKCGHRWFFPASLLLPPPPCGTGKSDAMCSLLPYELAAKPQLLPPQVSFTTKSNHTSIVIPLTLWDI